MAEYEFSVSDFEELAGKLDALGDEVPPSDRAILFAVFQMAADNMARRAGANPAEPTATGGKPLADLESLAPNDGRTSPIDRQIQALEQRIRRLEASVISNGSLESAGDRIDAFPTVQLRTESGGVPKLSEGFLRSFRGGEAARVMTADDVGVGVTIGVMF